MPTLLPRLEITGAVMLFYRLSNIDIEIAGRYILLDRGSFFHPVKKLGECGFLDD